MCLACGISHVAGNSNSLINDTAHVVMCDTMP